MTFSRGCCCFAHKRILRQTNEPKAVFVPLVTTAQHTDDLPIQHCTSRRIHQSISPPVDESTNTPVDKSTCNTVLQRKAEADLVIDTKANPFIGASDFCVYQRAANAKKPRHKLAQAFLFRAVDFATGRCRPARTSHIFIGRNTYSRFGCTCVNSC